jgi:hypothetical protein
MQAPFKVQRGNPGGIGAQDGMGKLDEPAEVRLAVKRDNTQRSGCAHYGIPVIKQNKVRARRARLLHRRQALHAIGEFSE